MSDLGLQPRHRGAAWVWAIGGGRGRRNMYYATGLPGWARAGAVPPVPAVEQELADLKAQAGWLAGQLDAIQKRIEDFEGRDAAGAAS